MHLLDKKITLFNSPETSLLVTDKLYNLMYNCRPYLLVENLLKYWEKNYQLQIKTVKKTANHLLKMFNILSPKVDNVKPFLHLPKGSNIAFSRTPNTSLSRIIKRYQSGVTPWPAQSTCRAKLEMTGRIALQPVAAGLLESCLGWCWFQGYRYRSR